MNPVAMIDLPFSTMDSAVLEAYAAALDMLHRGRGDPLACIERALQRDPGFAMGHALRAALLILASDEALEGELAESVLTAEALASSASDWERRHIAAARTWLQRDVAGSTRLYGDILMEHPHDTLALRVAHFGDFLLGHTAMLRDRVAQVLPHWHSGVPHYGHVLGMYAFGLEEDRRYEPAEQIGRAALAVEPDNPTAIHAVAHVMEMQGRALEGIAWLEATRAQWQDASAIAVHLWWHLALFHLDGCDSAAALRIYDRQLGRECPRPGAALVDASALLWRLHLRGVDVAGRWRELADAWAAHAARGRRPFSDVHALLAFVADRQWARAETLVHGLRDLAARSPALDRVVGKAARPLCEALLAFGRGEYADAAARLANLRNLMQRCGGSLAQCDLLHLTMIEAALRAGQFQVARALTAERTARRPESAFNQWLAARARAPLAPGASEQGLSRSALKDSPASPIGSPTAGSAPASHARNSALQNHFDVEAGSLHAA